MTRTTKAELIQKLMLGAAQPQYLHVYQIPGL
jgi:hypothetical protein